MLKNGIKNRKGQTILELSFFLSFFSVFLVLMYVTFSMFNISQKQEMLLRTQAFMELGNFADFGGAKHGEDDVKGNKSKVRFQLGSKSQLTRVDISKEDKFIQAVQGSLEIDVTRSLNDDHFWNTYQFPKASTKLVWLLNRNAKGLIELDLQQSLWIVHNRSIDLKKPSFSLLKKENGMFSGSIQMEAFGKLVAEAQKMTQEQGLIDDLDRVREISRKFVKNDPSLAKEAEKLEKSLSAVDGLVGGAQAALINAAISVAMVHGLQQLQGLNGAEAASKAGTTGAQGATGASGSVFSKLTGGIFNDPATAAQSVAKGDALGTAFRAITAPITNVTEGFAGLSSGVSGLAQGAGGAWGNLTTAFSGLAQMGQTASFASSLAGSPMVGLDMATAALSAPGAITSGVANLNSSLANFNTGGVGDWTGAIRAVTQIVTPITNLVSLTSSDLAVPMSYINTGLGLAGTISSGVDLVKNFDPANKSFTETLTDVGMFTTSAGALYSGIAGLTGNDATLGAYISLGGSALVGLGGAIEFAKDLKKEDLKPENPFDVAGHVVKKNWDGLKESAKEFGHEMNESAKTISTSWSQMMGPKVKIDDPNAKDFMTSLKHADKETSTMVDNVTSGFRAGNLSPGNLQKAGANMKEMEEALVLNMKYSGANPAEISEVQTKMSKVHETIDHLGDFKNQKTVDGKTVEYNPQLVAEGKQAADDVNKILAKHMFGEVKEDKLAGLANPYTQQQIKAIRAGTSQKALEESAVRVGQTFTDQKEMERALLDQKGFSGFWYGLQSVNGGDRTKKAFDTQERKAAELAMISKIDSTIGDKKKAAKRAVEITQISEGISLYGPIVSDKPRLTRDQAAELSKELKEAQSQPGYSSTMKNRMELQSRKLEMISQGQIEILSERDWFDYAQKNVDQSLKKLEDYKGQLDESLEATKPCDFNGDC